MIEEIRELFSRRVEDFAEREPSAWKFAEKYCLPNDLIRSLEILDEAYIQGFRLYKEIIETIRDIDKNRKNIGDGYTEFILSCRDIRDKSVKRLKMLEKQTYDARWNAQQNQIQGGQ